MPGKSEGGALYAFCGCARLVDPPTAGVKEMDKT